MVVADHQFARKVGIGSSDAHQAVGGTGAEVVARGKVVQGRGGRRGHRAGGDESRPRQPCVAAAAVPFQGNGPSIDNSLPD
jgi:hypothetical protein